MDHWISFIYLYGVGGILFYGIIFWAWKKGVLNFKRSSDRFLIKVLVAGYFTYMLAQGTWNYIAISSFSGAQ